ncbi:MAG: hypothetical protein AAF696_33975, partial [Bacteroidota bacterium]
NRHGVENLKYIVSLVDKLQSGNARQERRNAFWRLTSLVIHQAELMMSFARLNTDHTGGETRKKLVTELFKKLDIDITLLIPIWMELIEEVKSERYRSYIAAWISDAGFEDKRISPVMESFLGNIHSEQEHTRRRLAEGLIKHDPTNSEAISALFELLKNSESSDTCRWVANGLGEACNDNHSIVTEIINLLNSTNDQRVLNGIKSGIQEVFQMSVLKIIVNDLKGHLTQEVYENNFPLYQSSFEILWHCASRLSYTDFYKVWHKEEYASSI